jgi:hypothetical protein
MKKLMIAFIILCLLCVIGLVGFAGYIYGITEAQDEASENG